MIVSFSTRKIRKADILNFLDFQLERMFCKQYIYDSRQRYILEYMISLIYCIYLLYINKQPRTIYWEYYVPLSSLFTVLLSMFTLPSFPKWYRINQRELEGGHRARICQCSDGRSKSYCYFILPGPGAAFKENYSIRLGSSNRTLFHQSYMISQEILFDPPQIFKAFKNTSYVRW